MKYFLTGLLTVFLIFSGAAAVHADSPLYLPHITSGTLTQPGGTNLEIAVESATTFECDDRETRMVVTAESDTRIDVACLPTSATEVDADEAALAALTPAATNRTVRIVDSASLVCEDEDSRIRISRKGRRNIDTECVPAATSTPIPTSTPEPTETPVAAPPDNEPQPIGQGEDWSLIFSDEFSGTSLNLDVWEPSWFGGNGFSHPVNTLEDGCYHPSQVSLNDGMLNLDAGTTNDPACRTRSDTQTSYISGLINTRESFTFVYGYMEARIFLPGSDGELWNWPAFWSDGTGTWPKTGEIDVMEGLSSRRACWHYHYEDSSGEHQGPGDCADFDATGWHTYAALWEPGKITYYYDGVQVGQITEGVVDAEHFLILNFGIREDYGINVPSTMLVDYVRVWQP